MKASFPAAEFLKIFIYSPKAGGMFRKQATQKVNLKDARTPLPKPEVCSVSLVLK